MKLSTFTKSVALSLMFCGTAKAQSWDLNSLLATNDTVAESVNLVTTDNIGNSYWASHYFIKNSSREGYLITKVDRLGAFISRTAVQANAGTYTTTGIADIEFISGALYVVSNTRKPNADVDVLIQKYSNALVKQWEVLYNDPNSKDDAGIEVLAGPNNGLLVSMVSFQDGAVINYARSNGAIINSVIYNNGATSIETIRSMTFAGGSVYIAGKNANGAGTNSDMFITRYDSTLTLVWNKVFDASQSSVKDEVIDINPDASGDILVTGNYQTATSTNSVFFTKYNDVNGSRLWLRKLTNDDIFATEVFADASSNVISVVNGAPNRYINLNGTTGAVITNKGIFNLGTLEYTITDVVASGNNLYLTGSYDSTYTTGTTAHTSLGVLVTKLNLTGGRLWNTYVTSTDATQYYRASCINLLNNSKVHYAANFFDSNAPTKRYYSQLSNISASNGLRTGDEMAENGFSVYPNPANDIVHLRLNNQQATNGQLTIYDLSGRLVLTENLEMTAGLQEVTVSVSELSEGTYIVRLNTGESTQTGKIIIY
ncbi:MAG: T9SS type A sorting domain-containing protein [Bacteroidia bacterium]